MAVTGDNNDWYTRASFWAASTPFTMMCWFNVTTNPTAGNYKDIIFQQSAQGFGLFNSGGSKLNAGTTVSDFTGTTTILTGVWYHGCHVRSVNAHTLYLNGVSEATGSDAQAVGSSLGIMTYAGSTATAFIGRIAAVKLWNVALTVGQVQQEMRQYCPVNRASLLAFYPMFSTADDEVDYSGNGATLTVTSTPVTSEGPPIPWRLGRGRYCLPTAGGAPAGDAVPQCWAQYRARRAS